MNRMHRFITVMSGGGAVSAPAAPTGLTVTPASASQFDLAWTDNATNETAYKVYRSTDGVNYAQVGDDLAAGATSYSDTTTSADTIYYYKVAAVNAGGETLSDASDPAYYFADNFDRTNGAIGNGWTGATWTVLTNKAINTPTLGPELLTNGGLETFTDGLADNWNKTSTPTTTEEATVVHGGSKSQKVETASANQGINQNFSALTIGAWYAASVFHNSARGETLQAADGNIFFIEASGSGSAGSWKDLYQVGRCSGNGATKWIRVISDGAGTIYYDDFSFKQLTLSTLFATRDTGMSDIDISTNMSNVYYVDVRQPGGIVACVDDPANPQNYLHAYWLRNTVYLDKVVNGNLTNLLTVTGVSHATDAAFRLVKDGTSVGVFYGGTQRGATQTVSDLSLISNTIHGISGMHPNTTINNLVMANPT